jgi:hypothetical protein
MSLRLPSKPGFKGSSGGGGRSMGGNPRKSPLSSLTWLVQRLWGATDGQQGLRKRVLSGHIATRKLCCYRRGGGVLSGGANPQPACINSQDRAEGSRRGYAARYATGRTCPVSSSTASAGSISASIAFRPRFRSFGDTRSSMVFRSWLRGITARSVAARSTNSPSVSALSLMSSTFAASYCANRSATPIA